MIRSTHDRSSIFEVPRGAPRPSACHAARELARPPRHVDWSVERLTDESGATHVLHRRVRREINLAAPAAKYSDKGDRYWRRRGMFVLHRRALGHRNVTTASTGHPLESINTTWRRLADVRPSVAPEIWELYRSALLIQDRFWRYHHAFQAVPLAVHVVPTQQSHRFR